MYGSASAKRYMFHQALNDAQNPISNLNERPAAKKVSPKNHGCGACGRAAFAPCMNRSQEMSNGQLDTLKPEISL